MRRLNVESFMVYFFGKSFLLLPCKPVVLLIALGYVFLFVTEVG
jgi:hypothetical protein